MPHPIGDGLAPPHKGYCTRRALVVYAPHNREITDALRALEPVKEEWS